MNAVSSQNTAAGFATHAITADDKTAMAALRAMVEPLKGKLQGTAGRPPFDAIMEHVPAPKDVSFEADTVGGIAGW
jgi:monoterpene epsilon-lactone hydrolase